MKRPGSDVLVLCAFAAVIAITPVPVVAQNESTEGAWSNVFSFGTEAIHMIALKNKKVLCVGFAATGGFVGPNACVLFDTTNDTVSAVFLTPEHPQQPTQALHNLHCSGHSALADGRIVFHGGPQRDFMDKTTIYDADATDPNEIWKVLDEDSDILRWYPTLTTLADGRILATAGHAFAAELAATPFGFRHDQTARWAVVDARQRNVLRARA